MTIYAVQFEPRAARQLANLEAYLAEVASPATSAAYVTSIVNFCQCTLSTFPYKGRDRSDLNKGLHMVGYQHRAVITYKINDEARLVSVVGVFYGGQNWETNI